MCVQSYHRPASVADLVAQIGVDPAKGLTRDDAMARRALYGANRVTPPINCPSWVCCLLPCLLRTASMQAYHAALPKEATVRRSGPVGDANGKTTTRRMRMDAMSLVYGDVVELRAGDLVSADMRVIECSPDCVVDQSTLAADDDDDGDIEAGSGSSLIRKLVAVVDDASSHSHGHNDRERHDPLAARNVLLMTSRVVRGTCVGVVVATGNATFWGQLLAQHQWPVASTSKRSGRVNKYPEHEQNQQPDEAHRLMDQKSNTNSKELLV